YLTAVQDRTDLLESGEFVEWHKQMRRTSRFRLYGDRKPRSRRANTTKDCTHKTTPVPRIAAENRAVGKSFIDKKCFTIWENVTDPLDRLYENQMVDRWPD